MIGLSTAGLKGLARLIWTKKLSARELLRHYGDRIDKHDGTLNAVVATDFDRAFEAAAAADEAAARGDFAGPLHGIPMTVKDAWETAGLVSTGGVEALKDHVPAHDAAAVARLRAAGAIIMGKTNVPAYSGDWQTYNGIYGTTNNPWDTSRTPGGSSGGAAAAVAAGLTPAEIGSDIGGSIRLPAHFCGIWGLKASYGTVPMRGHMPPAPHGEALVDLAAGGPLARSPEDLAILLDVLAGEADDAEFPRPPLTREPAGDASDLRIAVWRGEPAAPADAPVRAAVDATATALEAAGARVEHGRAPAFAFAECYASYCLMLNAVVFAAVPLEVRTRLIEKAGSIPDHDRGYEALQARGAALTYTGLLEIEEFRVTVKRAWRIFFEEFDAIVCPAASVAAFAHDHATSPAKRTIRVNGADAPYFDLMHWAAPASFAHLPALVAPATVTAGGLPVGVQVIGPYLGERKLIRIARLLEKHLRTFAAPPGFT